MTSTRRPLYNYRQRNIAMQSPHCNLVTQGQLSFVALAIGVIVLKICALRSSETLCCKVGHLLQPSIATPTTQLNHLQRVFDFEDLFEPIRHIFDNELASCRQGPSKCSSKILFSYRWSNVDINGRLNTEKSLYNI